MTISLKDTTLLHKEIVKRKLRAWNQGFISSVMVRDSLLQWHKTTVSQDTG